MTSHALDLPPASAEDCLRIYGNLSLLEMAPVLLATDRVYRGTAVIEHGGIMSLWGKDSDLASLSARGRSHIAANSETQALRGSFDNPDLRFIFTIAECPYRIVCRRSAGITRIHDLRGKRVGTMLKSSAQYFLDRMLSTAGLDERDVGIVHHMAKTATPLTLLPALLRDGRLDAVTVWEPQIQRAYELLGADAIVFSDPAIYRERFCLCTSAANLDDPALRARIVRFVRALIEATALLQHDPHDAQRLVATTASLDQITVVNAWPHLRCLAAPALPGNAFRGPPRCLGCRRRMGRQGDGAGTALGEYTSNANRSQRGARSDRLIVARSSHVVRDGRPHGYRAQQLKQISFHSEIASRHSHVRMPAPFHEPVEAIMKSSSRRINALELERGDCLRVGNVSGREVNVLDGRVWIAQDRDPNDRVLASGGRFLFDRDGFALAAPLKSKARVLPDSEH